MLAAALVAGVLMIPQGINGQYVGLIQWTTGPGANGHYYPMTELAGDYRDVSAVAATLGGTLASITTREENKFVHDSFVEFGTCSAVWCFPSTFFIGLRRVTPGGPFAWETGEQLSFTAWNLGEPNDFGDEPVAHVIKGIPGQPARAAPEGAGEVFWNDIPFDRYEMRGVIEWSVRPSALLAERDPP